MSVDFNGFREDTDGTKRIVRLPRDDDDPGFNLCNGNALAFLGFLGLPVEFDGMIDVATARRTIMRARAQFDRRAADFTREPEQSGHLVVDGVTHLDIPRVHAGGVDADYFTRRLDGFAQLVEDSAKLGATHIGWG